MQIQNARTHIVHLNKEPAARPRLIVSESGVFRIGDRVLVHDADLWLKGHVDHRAPSGPGGVVMVTAERPRTHSPALARTTASTSASNVHSPSAPRQGTGLARRMTSPK